MVGACERLFGLEADKLFQLTPAQHFGMLTENEPSELARERVLLYAALNQEAGLAYAALNSAAMARASFANALRFTLLARIAYGEEDAPAFAPLRRRSPGKPQGRGARPGSAGAAAYARVTGQIP